MLRPLYNWMMRQAAKPHAEIILAVISFTEASCFPLPPDIMLAPMVLARPERAWRYALVCAAASILGGCLGYYIGFALEPIGVAILHFFGNDNGLAAYREQFSKIGFWFVLGQGVTPIPYKLTTIAAGLAHFTFWQFILASCITRTTRFMVVAALCKRFGPEILAVVEKRLMLVGSIVLGLVVLGFVLLKLLGHHH